MLTDGYLPKGKKEEEEKGEQQQRAAAVAVAVAVCSLQPHTRIGGGGGNKGGTEGDLNQDAGSCLLVDGMEWDGMRWRGRCGRCGDLRLIAAKGGEREEMAMIPSNQALAMRCQNRKRDRQSERLGTNHERPDELRRKRERERERERERRDATNWSALLRVCLPARARCTSVARQAKIMQIKGQKRNFLRAALRFFCNM